MAAAHDWAEKKEPDTHCACSASPGYQGNWRMRSVYQALSSFPAQEPGNGSLNGAAQEPYSKHRAAEKLL